MKKVVIVIFLVLLGGVLIAQEQEDSFLPKKNEVKVNLPVSIFGEFPEVSYERILQRDISLGASLGVSLDGGDTYGLKAQFTPYFRWFFGGDRESARKYAAGFFMEANASVFRREDHIVLGNAAPTKTETGGGLGLGIGWKYITKHNWVGEILLGVGKDFSSSGDVYPHWGISIGKRF